MGFGLVIIFLNSYRSVTTNNYIQFTNSQLYSSLEHIFKSSQSALSSPVSW
jgi:hypothetical protein